MKDTGYNRQDALDYAEKWAFGRNPKYLDFEELGGDCTNFISQCIYAGCEIMNPSKDNGWYYYTSFDRAPAWTSVRFLYEFLTTNESVGPYAAEVDITGVEAGDIIQLGDSEGLFYHSLIIVKLTLENIYVAAHSFDAYMKPLSEYEFEAIRFLHIFGARKW